MTGRESSLGVGQHSPETTSSSAFRFMPSSVPNPSSVPGGLKQADCAVVGVGSLLRRVLQKCRACSQHLRSLL